MEFVDYYDTMGLDENATDADIKRAYRQLARKYHPDVSKEPDSEARFKELGEAYGVLKDEERRREYDQLRRHHNDTDGGFSPPPGWQYQSSINPEDFRQAGQGSADFSDFFEQMFGSRFKHHESGHSDPVSGMRGRDVHATLPVSIRDIYHGSTVEISLNLPTVSADGVMRTEQKKLNVKIPAGVRPGQKLRLKGQGGRGYADSDSGDLYIDISVKEDDVFTLDGPHVNVCVPITPWEAALGAVVEIPTLDGPVNLTIPANAKQGQRLRLKGRGLPGKNPGDQFALLTLVVPEAKTEEQKSIYESMSKLWADNPRASSGAK